MTRNSLTRTLSLGVFAVAASSMLVACGSDDSTATGAPTSTTSAVETTTEASSTTSAAETTTAAPTTSPGEAATAPPEQPQPVPDDFPGPTESQIDDRGQSFLDELRKQGVTPAGNGDIAVSTANYICAAQAQGVTAEEISTFVTANVGVEASASGTQMSETQAQQAAQTYIAAAQATYCRP
ncbi:DUF732 domain-containing protein [Rhodococcus cerastii]|uniref:DUF732 domain-containing protein n=1 Tax=Rhodococcus cerastii TaxID=908616 RepID=A0ABU4D102_9NOCA|nr:MULTISPECIES: DUF732 domain-containing protein [Rhodococcus]KZE98890.1 hypothetical protein A2J04_16420 [Rhodococcus sp. EPR-279]KZE99249.1 hypothetical protein A2J02_11225 [Rhodococcus sp. EPR-147]MDV6302806.1 DUF732 domain-containing protein [Rhodococcus cerastii]OZE40198.1 DUF732 domain-containing protein [Rhodococcus sp. 05-2254-4]OZE49766.1 DUF732 domain-containing protein [Rhodococcus sp. 05-2254-3]